MTQEMIDSLENKDIIKCWYCGRAKRYRSVKALQNGNTLGHIHKECNTNNKENNFYKKNG